MELEAVKAWLKRKAAAETVATFALGNVSLLAGSVVLAITSWLVAWLLLLGWLRGVAIARHAFGLPLAAHDAGGRILWLAALVAVLLFAGNSRYDRGPLLDFFRFDFRTSPPWEALPALRRTILDVLFSGPQFVQMGFTLWRSCHQWRRLDVPLCAQVLLLLAERGKRVPLTELSACVPGFDALNILAQVRLIDGVVYLKSPPPALSLTSDLRKELGAPPRQRRATTGGRRQARAVFDCAGCGAKLRIRVFQLGVSFKCPRCETRYRSFQDELGRIRLERLFARGRAERQEQPANHRVHEPSHHEVLGVKPEATLRDIKRAYRKMMKENHPDLVSRHDDSQREAAEERAKRINLAYAALKAGFEE